MKQDFTEYIKAHIKDYLPPEYQDAVISSMHGYEAFSANLPGCSAIAGCFL